MTPLRAWRKRVRISQLDLSRALGVDRTTVNRWELGHSAAPPYLWLALAAVEAGMPRPVEAPQ